MDEGRAIVARDDVPADGTLLFSMANGENGVEGILLELADGVVAFENYCQHWRDVRLDSGDGATMRDGEIICEKHGAYFESESGYCNFGPCEGAFLEEIDIEVTGGTVYLTDNRYSNPQLGPVAPDDGDSGSRIGFSGN